MQLTVSLIVLLALTARTCVAEIVMKTSESEEVTNLHKAMIDILTTCYGDSTSTIGIVSDSDGSILKALWSKNSRPVVLVDTAMQVDNSVTTENQHRLQVFVVVADSPRRFESVMSELVHSIWWNHYANFLILRPTVDRLHHCSQFEPFLLFVVFKRFGVLNAQAICVDGSSNVSIINSNPFTRTAPEPWQFLSYYDLRPAPFNVFKRTYREGGQTCEALNFDKTMDLGRYPFHVLSEYRKFNDYLRNGTLTPSRSAIYNVFFNSVRSFIHFIVMDMNATPIFNEDVDNIPVGMEIATYFLSDNPITVDDRRTYPLLRDELYGITQHTGHMSQLEKILSVVDKPSRIGMLIVYLITFLFFKFFLRQALVPSILDLVRLTCSMGLVKLPSNVAPTIYLAGLFMYVVTFQGIFTGNLSTLLTTNIHYPNVNKKEDIVDLGYTVYTSFERYFDDPKFDGRVVPIEQTSGPMCVTYPVRDPLAVCVNTFFSAIIDACVHRLHLSRDAMNSDYTIYMLTKNNPFGRRLDTSITRLVEHGLGNANFDNGLARLQNILLSDNLVNSNMERKVIDVGDLRFAFVILGIGLTCSLVCFICEIVIYRVRLKIAKRRARARNRVLVTNRDRPLH